MKLCMRGHSYRFELENICRLFLPQEPVTVVSQPDGEGLCALTVRETAAGKSRLSVRLSWEDFDRELTAEVPQDMPKYEDECELTLATLLYRLFSELFGVTQTWGIVTGVRPVKLLRRLRR